METSSTTFISPSFNTHPANDIADIADRVVHELRTQNGSENDDVFTFTDDDDYPLYINEQVNTNTNTNNHNHTQIVKRNEEKNADEHEFEFPVSSNEIISDDQISLQYPVFDRSLLSKTDFSFTNGVELTVTESKPVPSTRPSLRKLFSEDRESFSPSTSSSESDELNRIAPGTYCVWKPKTEKQQQQKQRGKHKKSNSISIGNSSKRWNVRDLLKRSYSDDSYSSGKDSPVVVIVNPVLPNDEKVNVPACKLKTEKNIPVCTKTEKNIPSYKSKVGNLRLPAYLPYRQDQVAAVGNFNGSSANLYRY